MNMIFLNKNNEKINWNDNMNIQNQDFNKINNMNNQIKKWKKILIICGNILKN